MITNESFHHMLRLAHQAGVLGRKLPDMGYLAGATRDQMGQLNEAYRVARQQWHADVIRKRRA